MRPRTRSGRWAGSPATTKAKQLHRHSGQRPRHTRGYQVVFHEVHGKEKLDKMEKHDPGLLDLPLGVLFRYDP